MTNYLLLIAILFPLIGGIIVLKSKNVQRVHLLTIVLSTLTSLIVWYLILTYKGSGFELIKFTDSLVLKLHFDSLGKFFAGIVSTLYPLTALYAAEYMEHDSHPRSFYFFFLIAYGITIGVTMSSDFFTLYVFYELLTLSTMPLVLHDNNKRSVRAARTYLLLSIGGASLAFASMVYILTSSSVERSFVTQLFYLIGFFGFGVKAAVFPTHIWLPKASVAPTPVTALLHAVAVVKSGIFAIIRLTYFIYGIENINNSFAQYIAISFVIFTIFYGATKAVKETHFKRKMAYSTVANLSYILFGILLMNEWGYIAGLLHMAFHAEIKILAFFVVGAVMHNTHREYVGEIDGLARKMPITFICYTVAGLALTGIPPLAGFVSKSYLLIAGIKSNNFIGIVGVVVLLISALLTAMYTLIPARHAFFPDKEKDLSYLDGIKEVGPKMCIPMSLLAISILLTGLLSGPIVSKIVEISLDVVRWIQ